jgi:hypothetical protein
MYPTIDTPASCEIRALVRFLHAKIMHAAEIRRELCAVYDQNVTSEGTLKQWCIMFKDGRKNVYDEERSDWPSVVSNNLVQIVDQKFVKDGASQFRNFRVNFHKFHALFSMRLSKLGFAIIRFA